MSQGKVRFGMVQKVNDQYAKRVMDLKERVILDIIPPGEDPYAWAKSHNVKFITKVGKDDEELLYVDGSCIGAFRHSVVSLSVEWVKF